MGFSRQEYWSGLPFKSIRGKQNWKMEWENLFSHHCQGMFNSRIPVCCFLSLLSPLFLVSPLWGGGAGKPLPGPRSKRWDACIGFPSLAFPFGERDCLRPSFDMDCLLALWPLLLFASLVNLWSLVSWSLSKEAIYIYIYIYVYIYTYIYTLTEFNKAPLFHQSLGPLAFLFFSFNLSLYLSISGWFPGAQRPAAKPREY